MQVKINKEFKNIIPPLSNEEKEILEKSIIKEGIREPLIIWNDTLIDGHNRKEIADRLKLKYKTKKIKFKDKSEAIIWIINTQLGRRNLVPYDRTRLVLKYENIFFEQAKESQKNPFGKKVPQEMKGLVRFRTKVGRTDKRVGRTDKRIGNIAKVGKDTVSKVKFIERKANKKTKERLSQGEETINKIYTILKRQEKVKKIKKDLIKRKPKQIKNKKYEIVYADPAWKYNRKIGEGIAEEQYSLSSLDTMKKIPINHTTEKNSVLFMWVTFPLLKEGLELIDSWGFKYKTCAFNWIKLNKNGKPFFGIGYYTKSNSEICLLGVKGKGLPILDNTISQIIMTQKDIHSKKPQEVRNLITQLFGDRKRIELFAREKVKGWDTYGNEVNENG